jgi:methionyl-tRNA formyltransferase
MGTPDIAVPTLDELHNKYNIVAVVTTPDKPQGRGLQVIPSAVKIAANKLNLPVLQPNNLRDIEFIEKLKQLEIDIIIVFAFRFLPKEVYSISKISSFNIHTSLLPDYRGAAPIN